MSVDSDNLAPTQFLILQQEVVEEFDTRREGLAKAGAFEVDTAGYAEMRWFIKVAIENYEDTPIDRKKAQLTARFFHSTYGPEETRFGSHFYADHQIKTSVTGHIAGWIEEKIIGNKARLVLFARDLPPGPYMVTVTCYLVR